MQDYQDIAAKNGVVLSSNGECQFCGAKTTRGVHECVEIFSLGFQVIDYSRPENHVLRFISVDAHTLQHPEIHGRWNNHFHLTRQHLMFHYNVKWTYDLSPLLSEHLNAYKEIHPEEILEPPLILDRGTITVTDVSNKSDTEQECREIVFKWGMEVYHSWARHHELVDEIAEGFVKRNQALCRNS
ncbi:MAG: DUF5946 family protein [Bacteroidota bacterium]